MSWTTAILLGITGATAGVASGLLGIGGGTVVTPLLAIMTPLSQVSSFRCFSSRALYHVGCVAHRLHLCFQGRLSGEFGKALAPHLGCKAPNALRMTSVISAVKP